MHSGQNAIRSAVGPIICMTPKCLLENYRTTKNGQL